MISCQEKLWLDSNWCQYILWIVLDNKSKKMSNILIQKRDKEKRLTRFRKVCISGCVIGSWKWYAPAAIKRGSTTQKRFD